MVKKFLSLALVALLMQMASAQSAYASTKAGKEARFTEKVKAGIATLGVGPEARVKVKLRNKTNLEGYVSEVGEDYFMVTDAETGVATPVPYPQVKQVKGNNLSSGARIAIVVGIVALLVAIALAASGT